MNPTSLQRAPRQFKLSQLSPTEPQFMAWALVVAVAILSFFVHTLHNGIDRGESLRAAQRAGGGTAGAGGTQTPDWARTVAVSGDTRRSR